MSGGPNDSSLRRVTLVFDKLASQPGDWVRQLLTCPGLTLADDLKLSALDLRFDGQRHWGAKEKPLLPPLSLLSWLVRHPTPPLARAPQLERQRLAAGDPEAVAAALCGLRSGGSGKAWYILEGPTCPDVYLETPDALIVVEGKWTEPGPTLDTTWMPGRHQIWRHIDAAWEIRGRRQVFGFFIVDGADAEGALPPLWESACIEARSEAALASSLPHRGAIELAAIARCFIGATTWQAVCRRFGLDHAALPTRVVTPSRRPA